jgi:hypothetical protein
MTTDPRLERYLNSLENSLRPFPVSDRAEIITEIKSHVLSALERDPQTRLDTVLTALGEPETVANRYLLERGLKPSKTSISPIVKWLVIGFLTTFAMILVFAGYVLNHFHSLVSVDEPNSRVQIFGGLIDIDGKKNRVSVSGISDTAMFAGTRNLIDGQAVSIPFASGSIEVKTAPDQELKWACKGQGSSVDPKVVGGVMTFDLGSSGNVKCSVAIPAKHDLTLKGGTGKIEFDSPRFNIKSQLDAGKIEFKDDSNSHYKFAVSVGTGKADSFASSTEVDAYSIDLHVATGAIGHDD